MSASSSSSQPEGDGWSRERKPAPNWIRTRFRAFLAYYWATGPRWCGRSSRFVSWLTGDPAAAVDSASETRARHGGHGSDRRRRGRRSRPRGAPSARRVAVHHVSTRPRGTAVEPPPAGHLQWSCPQPRRPGAPRAARPGAALQQSSQVQAEPRCAAGSPPGRRLPLSPQAEGAAAAQPPGRPRPAHRVPALPLAVAPIQTRSQSPTRAARSPRGPLAWAPGRGRPAPRPASSQATADRRRGSTPHTTLTILVRRRTTAPALGRRPGTARAWATGHVNPSPAPAPNPRGPANVPTTPPPRATHGRATPDRRRLRRPGR